MWINLEENGFERISDMNHGRGAHVPLDVGLVAKVGLSVAIASFTGLLLLLLLIGDETGQEYAVVIGIFGLAKRSLGPAMIVFGLAIAGFAGITTWLFSLFASFRIAGPLYRFSRDLELLIERDSSALIPVRDTDRLQHAWKTLDASVTSLRSHYEDLGAALKEVQVTVPTEDLAAARSSIAHLRKVEQRVTL
jgi:hypothetical protein